MASCLGLSVAQNDDDPMVPVDGGFHLILKTKENS
jgi:hypothetical protein